MRYGLQFSKASNFSLRYYAYVDWASDLLDKQSTSGFCVYLGPNLVTWCCKKQATVSRSSAEAEYRSLVIAVAELMWIQSLLRELRVQLPNKPVLFCDNLSAVLLSHNPVLHARTKHMEIDIFFAREKLLKGDIAAAHLPSALQIADVFTKPLANTQLSLIRSKLNLVDLNSLSSPT